MRIARGLVVLLLAVSTAGAATIDFDGNSALQASLPSFAPARPAPSGPVSSLAAAASGSVSFHGVSLPADAFSRTDRIPASLVSAIDATRRTLRVAVYELNLPGVADAIVRAQNRGVDVEVVYDWNHAKGLGGTGSQGYAPKPSAQLKQLISAGVPIRFLRGSNQYGIMHNKFGIFDGELVETGSFNWTTAADRWNFENAVFRDDPSLASLFSSYFDWMWKLGVAPGAGAPGSGPFGTPPSDPSPSVPFRGELLPRVTFSPNGGTQAALAGAISRCASSVDVAIFSFYSPTVADAIIAAKNRGVPVRVVADAGQAKRSPEVAQLINAGVNVRLSSGRGGYGVLHHKFAVLDRELVATGSYNFSVNAEKNNFENQLMLAGSGDASAFGAEFEAVWAQAHAPQPGEVKGASVSGSVALR